MSNFILDTYKINAENQVKLAHIFSNNKYSNGSIREVNKVDVEKLEKILPKLGFEVHVHEDFNQIDCLKKLKEIAVDHEKEASIILVIFLSHGSLNEVKMTDDTTITIKQIAESFNSKGNSFTGKPKIFLFQMCQGSQSPKPLIDDEEEDEKLMENKTKTSEMRNNQIIIDQNIVEEVEDSTGSVPRGSDMFMGFSSSPSFVSYRSKKHGSRFIQTFTTIINDEIDSRTRTEKINFVSFMTKVAAEVADMSGKSWPSRLAAKAERKPVQEKTAGKVKMQVPWFLSTLTKQLEFEIFSEIQTPAPKQNDDDTQKAPKKTAGKVKMQVPWFSSTVTKRLKFETFSEIQTPAPKQNDDE